MSYFLDFFFSIVNIASSLEKKKTIDVQFFMAKFLPKALQDIISAEVMADMPTVSTMEFQPVTAASSPEMAKHIVPLSTPAISPMTSLQKLATASALDMSFRATDAPLTLRAAIELNTAASATVTLMPIISNRTPINIKKNNINTATHTLREAVSPSDTDERTEDMAKESRNIRPAHLKLNVFLSDFITK